MPSSIVRLESPFLSKSIWLSTATVAFALNLLSSSIAFSNEAAVGSAAVPATASSGLATTESATPAMVGGVNTVAEVIESKSFVAAGESYQDSRLGISITPPLGWEVTTNTGSLSLVMREPKAPKVVYDKVTYQRNITVAAIQRSSPIDEQRAIELKQELVKSFGSDTMISNFQVLDHKFFNYHGVNDGLVVYTSLNIGEYPMMQMHVLVSGQAKQFLLTYTDLAEAFSDIKNPNFEQAWTSIVSIDVTGMAPERRDELIRYGVVAGSILSFFLVVFLLRRRATRKDFNAEADAMEESSYAEDASSWNSGSMISTMHRGWNLKRSAGSSDALEFSGIGIALSQAAQPHTTSY